MTSPKRINAMSAKHATLDALQSQYDDISRRLKTAKKARDAQQRIAGKAILDAIEDQPDSGTSKMLVDLLHRFIVKTEDREVLGLDELVKQTSAAA
jgi:hypothetical protein